MELSSFRYIKIVTAIVLGMIFGWSVANDQIVIPVIAFAIAASVMFFARSRIKEVMADERDYANGGTAARWAIQVFSWISVAIMLALYANRQNNPSFETVASTLAYAVCSLMILYTLFFRYHDRIKILEKKRTHIIVGIALLALLTLVGIRSLSGEDGWRCEDGRWNRHGNPSSAAPAEPCP